MKRLNEALSESVGSESGDVAIQRGEAEHALLSCEASLGKKFDSRLGGAANELERQPQAKRAHNSSTLTPIFSPGFGGAPKFPRTSEIDLLLRTYLWHKVREGICQRACRVGELFKLQRTAPGLWHLLLNLC